MGLFSKIVRDAVGVASELGMFRDPYQRYRAPEIVEERRNGCGHVVQQTVRANSGTESLRHTDGTTIQGDRSVVSTHLVESQGRGWFDVHIENWDTGTQGKGMQRSEDFDPNDWMNYCEGGW